jgi:hypothetical protein
MRASSPRICRLSGGPVWVVSFGHPPGVCGSPLRARRSSVAPGQSSHDHSAGLPQAPSQITSPRASPSTKAVSDVPNDTPAGDGDGRRGLSCSGVQRGRQRPPTTREAPKAMTIHTGTNRTRTARTILATAVVAAGGLAAPSASAGPVEDNHRRCMAGVSGSADSMERRSQDCDVIGEEFASAYHDCMRKIHATPDSLERWVDHCANEATTTAFTD